MNVVWLKRDLRLQDNEALYKGLESEALIIYIFEPSISFNYDWDIRHWRFVYQSLQDVKKSGLNLHLFYGEALQVFKEIHLKYHIKNVFSHCETGNDLTYQRDSIINSYFDDSKINWHEYQTNMVKRGLKNKATWDALWIARAKQELFPQPQIQNAKSEMLLSQKYSIPMDILEQLEQTNDEMEIGGESTAWEKLRDFLENKIERPLGQSDLPDKKKYYSSLLSPYLSWGNLSVRQVYQECAKHQPHIKNQKTILQYMARLKWRCHFIQELEMEPDMEFKNLNSTFNHIRKKRNKKLIKAWKKGMTGYPLIDASMRCVTRTGYLNFKLRSTVTSFLTHLLWQPWQSGAGHLAKMFLDYEPGIHHPQFQMQAGTTGIKSVRIYNPIRQSKQKDKEGDFIKKWVPELHKLPKEYIHEPWRLTLEQQDEYEVVLGKDYPKPVVNFEKAFKHATEAISKLKSTKSSIEQSQKLVKKFSRGHKNKRKKLK